MKTARVITALAAAGALVLAFAPFLSYPLDARRLSQFSTDQPAAYWFGRAAVLLLVIGAGAAMRSLRAAAACAVVAAATVAVPIAVPALRRVASFGWAGYSPAPPPPTIPHFDAPPMWALGALLALATFTAAVLIVGAPRSGERRTPVQMGVVGLLALTAVAASLAVVEPEIGNSFGELRRYADYLPVQSGSASGSFRGWLAVAGVVLIASAGLADRVGRPFSAIRRRRSSR